MKIIWILVVYVGAVVAARAQIVIPDTITLINGQTVIGEVLEVNQDYIVYNYFKKKKTIKKGVSPLIVYSIAYASGQREVIYEKNEEEDLYLTKEEMLYFIKGQQDAREYYRTRGIFIGGFAIGGVAGYVLYDEIYVATVPFLYSVGAGLTNIEVRQNPSTTEDIRRTAAYQEGYLKVARSRKVFAALAGSVLGTAAGIFAGNVTR
ncbi:MAG TPA: hypothetical protein DDX92_03850 [Flavobacteriales bacterium]|jgi:hypothetical protein|nr:hypothetical protein [Flavobacteriales bacterium]